MGQFWTEFIPLSGSILGGIQQARVFKRSGHTVKLISPQFVKPFVKTNKNDANDAHAILEAVSRLSLENR